MKILTWVLFIWCSSLIAAESKWHQITKDKVCCDWVNERFLGPCLKIRFKEIIPNPHALLGFAERTSIFYLNPESLLELRTLLLSKPQEAKIIYNDTIFNQSVKWSLGNCIFEFRFRKTSKDGSSEMVKYDECVLSEAELASILDFARLNMKSE